MAQSFWESLIEDAPRDQVLPWLGGGTVESVSGRTWRLVGPTPPEYGWYVFRVASNRSATWAPSAELPPGLRPWPATGRGYLVGDRIVFDQARVDPDPAKLFAQTSPVHLIEPGLERFARASVGLAPGGGFVYIDALFPDGPEAAVLTAFQERLPSVAGVKGVTPALDLAFRFMSLGRDRAERRARERELLRLELERREAALRSIGTAVGRRVVAQTDFAAAARAALSLSGAELLDWRRARARAEVVVQYRLEGRRFECVVDGATLRVVDAGICLQDHDSGEKGDTWLTLESLPGVVAEARRRGLLHVFRHLDDDHDDEDNDD